MGVWGAGIFSDGTAADVRDDYRECLAEAMNGPAATEKVLSLYTDSQDDPDDGPPFWLSLAAVQYRYGRLEDRVRNRALKIIEDGSDVVRFSQNPKLRRARERVLEKLRGQLVGPQRRPANVRREVPTECDWGTGEVVGFRRDSGEWTALQVQGIGQSGRNRYPVVCVLDVAFDNIAAVNETTPVRKVLSARHEIGPRRSDGARKTMRLGPSPDCFHIFGLKKRDLRSDRIRRTGTIIPPKVKIIGDGILVGSLSAVWSTLSEFLEEFFV